MENNEKFDVLTIGSGGIKGFTIMGALSYFEKYGLLTNISKLSGCSVGAIICLLLNCGYTTFEIISEACSINFIDELETMNFVEMWENKGIFKGESLDQLLSKLIIKKYDHVLTLKELYVITRVELAIITYNKTTEESVNLSYLEYPDLSCVDAILMSCSIPGIFYKRVYNNNIFNDGALGNPYPIDIFDNGERNILGIFVDTKFILDDENPIKEIISSLYASIKEIRKIKIKYSSNKCFHLRIDCKNFNLVETSGSDKFEMVRIGYEIAKEKFPI